MGATQASCARSMRSADTFLPPRAFVDSGGEDGSEALHNNTIVQSDGEEADANAAVLSATAAQPGKASPDGDLTEEVVGVAHFDERALAFLFSDANYSVGGTAKKAAPLQGTRTQMAAYAGNKQAPCSDRLVEVDM